MIGKKSQGTIIVLADSVSDKRITKHAMQTVVEKPLTSDQIQAEDVKIEIREDSVFVKHIEKVISEEKVMEKIKIEISAYDLLID
jgi:glutamate racemase